MQNSALLVVSPSEQIPWWLNWLNWIIQPPPSLPPSPTKSIALFVRPFPRNGICWHYPGRVNPINGAAQCKSGCRAQTPPIADGKSQPWPDGCVILLIRGRLLERKDGPTGCTPKIEGFSMQLEKPLTEYFQFRYSTMPNT